MGTQGLPNQLFMTQHSYYNQVLVTETAGEPDRGSGDSWSQVVVYLGVLVCDPNIPQQTSSSVDALVSAAVSSTAATTDTLFSEVHLSLKRLFGEFILCV